MLPRPTPSAPRRASTPRTTILGPTRSSSRPVIFVIAALLSLALGALSGCRSEVYVIPFGSHADDVNHGDTGAQDAGTQDAHAQDAASDAPLEADAGGDVEPDLSAPDVALPDADLGDIGHDAADDVSPDIGTDTGVEAWRVGIGTFNVSRYFDTVCDSGQCGPGDFELQPSAAQFAYRTNQIAEALTALNVDIAVLQEVENLTCLEALRDALAWTSGGAFIIGETEFPASMDVAVLARRGTLLDVVEHRERRLTRPDGSSTRFSREFLEVHLQIDGRRVIVFAAHFKSKNSDDPGRRWAEAQAAGHIIASTAAAYPEALIVLGGDLNDTPGSEPLEALEAEAALHRVASVLGDNDGTYRYRGTDTAIDHLYLSEAATGSVVRDTVHILRDASGGFGGSDHAALRATFGVQ